MKKLLYFLIFILSIILLTNPALADNGTNSIPEDNPYLYDSLKLQLELSGDFNLSAESSSSRTEEVSVELLLFPIEDYRQEIAGLNHRGEKRDNTIFFRWEEPTFGKKEFGYTALVWTKDQRKEVRRLIPFPLEDITGYEEYLQPTETIDSNNPKIIARATELAEGENDLFKVAFKVADWVERNVDYDLSTLTAGTSQKASWVLENRQGVCDEMTSLFVAMMRSLGIPARFVSGVSYTTSPLFANHWQPHGWAEVFFPGVGWVSFDITFGEYGYVDVTHIKLRDSFDPQEAATKYEWIASRVNLQAGDLKLETEIKSQGNLPPDEIKLSLELLAEETDFGSYNLARGIVTNLRDHYAAATLQLAIPAEAEIQGRNRKTILLPPGETKEIYWIIKVKEALDSQYHYQLPVILYSEKNLRAEGSFRVQSGRMLYSEEEIEELIVRDEEKSYSRKIDFDCDYPKEINLGEEKGITCQIKNAGNANLHGINFCLKGVCEIIELPINQAENLTVMIKGDKPGWEKAIVSAENELIEKKMVLDYVVLDEPKIELAADFPAKAGLGELIRAEIKLEKSSFSAPQKVKLKVEWLETESFLEIDVLDNSQSFLLELPTELLSWENEARITVTWEDREGRQFSAEKELSVPGEAGSFEDKLMFFLNLLLKTFY